MDLLEREQQLARAGGVRRRCAGAARAAGQGRLVLVAGEAGVGKSSLLEAVRSERPGPGARWAWGGCDGGFTPSAARSARRRGRRSWAATWPTRCRAGRPRAELFAALLQALGDPDPGDRGGPRGPPLGRRGDPRPGALPRPAAASPARAGPRRPTATSSSSPPTRCAAVLGGARLASDPPGGSTCRRSRARPSPGMAAGSGLDAVDRPRPDRWQPLLRDRGAPLGRRRAARLGPGRRARAGRRRSATALARRCSRRPSSAHGSTRTCSTRSRDPDPADLDALVSSGLLVSDGRELRFRHELTRRAVLDATPAHRLHRSPPACAGGPPRRGRR